MSGKKHTLSDGTWYPPIPVICGCPDLNCHEMVYNGKEYVRGHYRSELSIKTQFKKGVPSWNKGLTKETDERVKNISESEKGKFVSEETRKKQSDVRIGTKSWNKGMKMSQEFCDKISKSQIGRVYSEERNIKLSILNSGSGNPMYGKPAPDGAGYGKGKYYNTQFQGTKWLRSSYEIKSALYYDKHKILWYYELVHFPVILNGKQTTYTPDFFLIEEFKFIDAKGYPLNNADKIQAFKEQYPYIKLDVLFYNDLIKLGIKVNK